MFKPVEKLEGAFVVQMARDDLISAWKSHATLARQANGEFSAIIAEIAALVCDASTIDVPYTTRAWFAKLKG